MRTPTNSEKFLLGVLALIAVGGAVFFGGSALLDHQRLLERQEKSLHADQLEAMVDLQEEPLWTKRAQWLAAHQPAVGDAGTTQAEMLHVIVQGARDHHLEIADQNLGPLTHGPGGARVSAALKIKGSMEALSRWLAELQQPSQLYAVDSFSLKADADEKSVICELHLSRYYREGGS